jgi:hypothetical protein
MVPSLKTNDDGSLTIYIQHDSPGVDANNRLVALANVPIYLAMRLQWSKTESLRSCRRAKALETAGRCHGEVTKSPLRQTRKETQDNETHTA